MKFNSLGEAIRYIKSQKTQCLSEIGKESEEIIKNTTNKNLYNNYSPVVYSRTYDMLKMIKTSNKTNDSVTVGFQDIGGHRSWKEPHPHVFVAPILEEGGYTWESGGRKPPTHIIQDSKKEIEEIAPNIVVKVLNSKGIKAHKK